jgi:hypothetical protein
MTDESSSAISAKRDEKYAQLAAEKAKLIDRQTAVAEWQSNLYLAKNALKAERSQQESSGKTAAEKIKTLEAKRDLAEMTLQDMRRRLLEVEHSVALIDHEADALGKKWEAARDLERAERKKRNSRGHSR